MELVGLIITLTLFYLAVGACVLNVLQTKDMEQLGNRLVVLKTVDDEFIILLLYPLILLAALGLYCYYKLYDLRHWRKK